jgi:hypothetical protein
MDLKTPIDFKTVGKDRWKFPSYYKVGYNMGDSLTKQKKAHLGLPQGPKSENEVLHVINLDQIDPSDKESIIRGVFEGAKAAGCTCIDKIKFINSKEGFKNDEYTSKYY